MAGGADVDEDGIVAINVTPLVDVMLVLLIIFMVTTTTIQNSEAMAVNKPDAATGSKLNPKDNQILLQCRKDGVYAVDLKEVSETDPAKRDAFIEDAITTKLAKHRDLQGVIQCDEEANVGSMVHLMDLLRKSGVKRYAVATEKPKNQKGS